MTSIDFSVAQELSESLAWMLVHSLWQGTVISLLLALLLRVLRNRSAEWRYSLACLALLATIIAPVMTVLRTGRSSNPVPPSGVESAEKAAASRDGATQTSTNPFETSPLVETVPAAALIWDGDRSPTLPVPSNRRDAVAPVPSSLQPQSPPESTAEMSRWTLWAVAIWLLGVGGGAARIGLGFVELLRLRREMIPAPAVLEQRTSDLSSLLGLSQGPRVGLSPRLSQAIVTGYIRPIILLPASWATSLPGDVLEAVLAHELAHIRRFDLWSILVQRSIETLLFFHPAVWWLSGRISFERELCCDALAVGALGSPRRYAGALEQIGTLLHNLSRSGAWSPTLTPTLGGQKMELLRRIQHVFRMPESSPRKLRRGRGVGPSLGIGLLLLCAWLATITPMGESTAAPPQSSVPSQATPSPSRDRHDSEEALLLRLRQVCRTATVRTDANKAPQEPARLLSVTFDPDHPPSATAYQLLAQHAGPIVIRMKGEASRNIEGWLTSLEQVQSLRALYIDSPHINEGGLKSLLESASLTNLRVLEISADAEQRFGDSSAKLLAKLPQLEELSLRNVALTQTGWQALLDCGSLRTIHLRRAEVTLTSPAATIQAPEGSIEFRRDEAAADRGLLRGTSVKVLGLFLAGGRLQANEIEMELGEGWQVETTRARSVRWESTDRQDRLTASRCEWDHEEGSARATRAEVTHTSDVTDSIVDENGRDGIIQNFSLSGEVKAGENKNWTLGGDAFWGISVDGPAQVKTQRSDGIQTSHFRAETLEVQFGDQTGRLMFGVGINSAAGLTGQLILGGATPRIIIEEEEEELLGIDAPVEEADREEASQEIDDDSASLPTEQEQIDEVLKAWSEAADGPAHYTFKRYIYNTAYLTETRAVGEVWRRDGVHWRVDFRPPDEVPSINPKKLGPDGEPYRVCADASSRRVFDGRESFIVDVGSNEYASVSFPPHHAPGESEKLSQLLPNDEQPPSTTWADRFRFAFMPNGRGACFPSSVGRSIDADAISQRYRVTLGGMHNAGEDQQRAHLVFAPKDPRGSAEFSKIDVLFDMTEKRCTAVRIFDPTGTRETVYVFSNYEGSLTSQRPGRSLFPRDPLDRESYLAPALGSQGKMKLTDHWSDSPPQESEPGLWERVGIQSINGLLAKNFPTADITAAVDENRLRLTGRVDDAQQRERVLSFLQKTLSNGETPLPVADQLTLQSDVSDEEHSAAPDDRPTRADKEPTPRDDHRRIESRLGRKVDLEFVDVPLKDALEQIGREHLPQPIAIDADAVRAAGADFNAPVSLVVSGITLRSALKLILTPHDLGSVIVDGTLTVTNRWKAGNWPITRVYAVADLLVPGQGPSKEADDPEVALETLTDLIVSTIAPESWDTFGGAGRIAPYPANLSIVVQNTDTVHRRIETLLSQLRRLAAGRGGKQPEAASAGSESTDDAPLEGLTPIQSEEEVRIAEALQNRFSLQLTERPFIEALREIQERARINVVLDEQGLLESALTPDQPVTIHLKDVPLEGVLTHLLRPLGLDFKIKDEVLLVTSAAKAAGPLYVVVYRMNALVEVAEEPDQSTQIAELNRYAELIRDLIAPNEWDQKGGSGSLAVHAATNSLIVRQNRRHHDRIADFLSALSASHKSTVPPEFPESRTREDVTLERELHGDRP